MTTMHKKDEGAQFVRFFGPLLDALRGLGGSAKPDEAVDRVSTDLKISDEVLNETLPSGGSRFRNQVAWARFYLVREGFISSSKHGVWSLTELGFKTRLTQEQARSLFLKWVKIFQVQRKQKEASEPVAEKIAEETGAYPRTIETKHSKCSCRLRQQASNASHSAYCARLGSLRSWSLVRVETEELTGLESCK